ncbi:MAG: hypothetical protein ACE15B_14305 [Bryobacteraceae bacterium]
MATPAAAVPRIVLDRLYEAGVDHLHDLEEKYHASVEPEMEQLASDEEKLLADWPLKGIQVKEDAGVADLYQVALEVERRARSPCWRRNWSRSRRRGRATPGVDPGAARTGVSGNSR